MRRSYFILVILIVLLSKDLSAQDNSSSLKLFFEKVYLHTDRGYYASGDDIWFKAYLINAQNNYLINTSKNLYAELIDLANNIIARHVIRLDKGIGIGDFKLDDSIAGGNYRIRAYTNWMRNFGAHFIFEKDIQVSGVTATSKFKASEKVLPQAFKIQFFPEGGSLVQGIVSEIAFKAEDENGNGVDAAGIILSSAGDTVVHFKSTHLGMGSFAFKPLPNLTYRAMVKYKDHTFTPVEFASISPDGFVLKVIDSDSSKLTLNIFSNAATLTLHPSAEITIAAKHAGKIIYTEKATLKNNSAVVTIRKKDFPTGIASVTVFDENLVPYCQRLVYIQGKDPLIVNVSADKNTYASKEKILVNISVTNAQQQPVKASLSLAATDAGIVKQPGENILSYIMLQSEIKGKIENAAEYFNEKNSDRFQQLDLLLRAQGWRDFLWKRMADTSIRIRFLPEQGITISGTVKQGSGGKTAQGMNITLVAPAAKGNKIFLTKTNSEGNYYLDGLPLYGSQTIKINSKTDKGKKGGELFIDTLYNNIPAVNKSFTRITDTSLSFKNFQEESVRRLKSAQNTKWYNVLPEVVVTSKQNTEVLRDGEAYMSFGFPSYKFTITPKDYEHKTVQDFLVQKIPGAVYDVENGAVNFIANGKPQRARIRVQKREDVFDRIDYYEVPLTQVNSIAVKHMIGMNLTDVFIIDLDLKPGAFNTDLNLITTDITGYYEARIFYSPVYDGPEKIKTDERTTIHWEPLITTDENGKAKITFYNADPKTKIRIDVQGITDTGIPVAAEKYYDVK